VEVFSTPKENIFKIQHLDIEPQTELVGEKIGIGKQNVDIKSLIYM
jgi:hypothetical protein